MSFACLQSLQGLTGTPLVAGSPIRHESAVQGSAVEVQTYQPPWKALSEFALQSDLDQPAFQQLVRLCATAPTSGLSGWEFSLLAAEGRGLPMGRGAGNGESAAGLAVSPSPQHALTQDSLDLSVHRTDCSTPHPCPGPSACCRGPAFPSAGLALSWRPSPRGIP